MSRRGWILFAAVSLVWGIPYLLIRISVREISPPTLVFLRTAPSGLILAIWTLRRSSFAVIRRYWCPIVAFTFFELGATWLLLSRAEQRLPSSIAGLLIATVPLVSVVLSRFTKLEGPLGWRRLSGLALGFVGVAALAGDNAHGTDLIAVGEIGVVALGYALGPFIVSRYLSEVPGNIVITVALLLTSVAYSPFALTHLPTKMSGEVLTSVIILIVICTMLAFVLFFLLIAEVGSTRATVVTYVNPVVAVVLGILILHERFSAGLAIAFPLVLIGSFLATGGIRRDQEPRGYTVGTARRKLDTHRKRVRST